MGLFSRRDSESSRIERIHRMLEKEFRRAGVRGRLVLDPADPYNTSLETDEGSYGFANATLLCLGSPEAEWPAIVARHVAGIVAAMSEPDRLDLDDPQIWPLLRARIYPEDGLPDGFGYARLLAPGLVEALTIDLPTTVRMLMDQDVADRDLQELFTIGRANLRHERIDERQTIDGIEYLSGESFFTASQVLNPDFARDVLGGAPRGFVFLAPDRHSLLVHAVTGADSVRAISHLASVSLGIDPMELAGGLVSSALYYSDGRIIQIISDRDPESGEFRILGEGPFLDAING